MCPYKIYSHIQYNFFISWMVDIDPVRFRMEITLQLIITKPFAQLSTDMLCYLHTQFVELLLSLKLNFYTSRRTIIDCKRETNLDLWCLWGMWISWLHVYAGSDPSQLNSPKVIATNLEQLIQHLKKPHNEDRLI